MANDVKGSVNITIGANADVLNKVFADAQKKANSFTKNLAQAAALGAAAFVGLKEGVIGSVEAFAEAEAASKQLDAALMAQGILTEKTRKHYSDLADEISRMTGVDDDAVKATLAMAQGFMGTTEITAELAEAVMNLSAASGMDLNEAFEKVTKTIGTAANGLSKRFGIAIDETMTKQERMATVIEKINERYAGQEQAHRTVATSMKALGVQFGNLREEIGKRFAPVVERVTAALMSFVLDVLKRPELVDFIGKVILIGTALTGLIATIISVKSAFAVLAPVIGLISSSLGAILGAFATAGAAITAFFVGVPASVIVGVGTIIGGFTALMLGGDKMIQKFADIRKSITDTFSNVVEGFKKGGLSGAFDSFFPKNDDAAGKLTEQQKALNEVQKKAALQREADAEAHKNRLIAMERIKTEALLLQAQVGSKAMVDLKNQEAAILKQIDDEAGNTEIGRNQARINALNAQLAANRQLQVQEEQAHLQRMAELKESFAIAERDAKQLGFDVDMAFTKEQQNQLYDMALSEREAKRQVGFEMAKDQIERNNQFLKDQAQYGEAYAKINYQLHSREVQGAKTAADELVALQQSKNALMKAIGKAAAITQIGISTAEGATKAYAALAGIPFIGPGLGAVAAASLIAFGAERTAEVLAANEGGVVPGSGPNVDSVAAMLSPGELIVPRNNFDEVVGAVRDSRDGTGNADVVEAINGLSSRLEARPSLIIQGDMLTDDVFVDRLIQKISDRLEFGNARLVGVNA